MPTVGQLGKYRVKIHARDHDPHPVHFEFSDVVVRVGIAEVAVCLLKENRHERNSELLEGWNEYQKEN